MRPNYTQNQPFSSLKPVAVIFGGTNTEHEVSLVSAQGILANLDRTKYEVTPIQITKDNTWITPKQLQATYTPVLTTKISSPEQSLASIGELVEQHPFDVVFPVVHGPYGEDGTLQGLLELARIPYVGCGVASSAVCMDKVLQKNICTSYNIPITPYIWFTKSDWDQDHKVILGKISQQFSNLFPLFIKPANQGSSVGITKAHNQQELLAGIKSALTRDLKVIVELAITPVREIECALLGSSHNPQVSLLGEIIPDQEFYSYESKYLTNQSQAIIPADLSANLTDQIQHTALLAYTALDCYGLARIDFLLNTATNQYYLSEVNTMPGFTPISMYPKLWTASGKTYPQLLEELIDFAITRHDDKSQLNYSR